MHGPTERVWAGYASGNCDLKWSKLPYRMREYREAVDKFRDVSKDEWEDDRSE
jgi:hypothetical protein